MYYQRHHLENKQSTICPINNTKCLKIQRYCNGMPLYFVLCWRDIFRLLILIAFVCQLLRSNIFAGFEICLLIPHFIFVLLFIFSNIYEGIHTPDKYKYGVGEWCVSMMKYIFISILLIVLPSFSFYSLHWTQEYGCIPRLFTDGNDTKPLKIRLLKYILNNNKTEEIKRRIVVVNYYLTLVFTDKINDNSLVKINYFADMHNCNRRGLFNVNWTDIQKAAGSNIHSTKSLWFKSILSLFVVIYDIALLAFLQNTLVQNTLVSSWSVMCWVCIAMDCILLFADAKYFELYWYCYHIFPFVDETHRYQVGAFCLNIKCGNIKIEDTMDNIAVLYSIMFDSVEKLTLIQNFWDNIHPDIVAIIGQYLRFSLPIYQRNETENELKLKFDKIIKSFKDYVNVSMVSINTHISTN